jgi:hypothetical protein
MANADDVTTISDDSEAVGREHQKDQVPPITSLILQMPYASRLIPTEDRAALLPEDATPARKLLRPFVPPPGSLVCSEPPGFQNFRHQLGVCLGCLKGAKACSNLRCVAGQRNPCLHPFFDVLWECTRRNRALTG